MDLSQGHMGIVIIDHTMGLQCTSSSTVSHTLRIMQRLMEYSSQVEYQDIKEWTFNYYQLIQPNDQSGESTSRRVGLYTFVLQVITAFVKFGRSFSLIFSSQNQNLIFAGCAKEITELSAIQLIYLRV